MQNSRDIGTERGVALTCRNSDIRVTGSRGSRLYSANTRRGGSGLYNVVDGSTEMKVTLSLRACEVKEKGVECSLNVVT